MDDQLKDFEDSDIIEAFKRRIKSQRTFYILVAIMMFIIGFLVARLIYKYHHLL